MTASTGGGRVERDTEGAAHRRRAGTEGLVRRLVALGAVVGLVALGLLLLTLTPSFGAWLRSVSDGTVSLRLFQAALTALLAACGTLLAARRPIERGLARFREEIERVHASAEAPGPSASRRASGLLLAGAGAIGLVAVATAATDVDRYRALIREDGPVEYGSAVLWLVAALALAASLARARGRAPYRRAAYGVLLVFFVVCAGEEISWGQRIVGYEPGELVRALNKQNETNLHNIGSISLFANAFFAGALVFFFGLPWLLRRVPALESYARHRDLPRLDPALPRIFAVALATWVLVGIRFGTLGFSPLSLWGYYTQMDDEIFELLAAYGFFAFATLDLLPRRRAVRRESAAGETVPS